MIEPVGYEQFVERGTKAFLVGTRFGRRMGLGEGIELLEHVRRAEIVFDASHRTDDKSIEWDDG